MKKLTAKGKTDKKKYLLRGGPWGGCGVFLPPKTMVFTIRGQTGRYNNGRWEDV